MKLGHVLSFYMHRKKNLIKKIKKILGISKAIRVFESPLRCIWQFECSAHIFRGPCPTQQALMFKISRIQFDLVDGWICNKASSLANLTIFLSENIRKIYCLPPNYLSVYFIFTVIYLNSSCYISNGL